MFRIIFSIYLTTLLAKYFYCDVDMFHLYIRRHPDWYIWFWPSFEKYDITNIILQNPQIARL